MIELLILKNCKLNLENNRIVRKFKVFVVGSARVGKTTMLTFLTSRKFEPKLLTIGIDFHSYSCKYKDSVIKLEFWDAGGSKRFRFMIPPYTVNTDAFFLCYDITNKNTFEDIRYWDNFIKKVEALQDLRIADTLILIGIKKDLVKRRREVSKKIAKKKLAKDLKIPFFFEVSSKTGRNIDKIIKALMKLLLKKKKIWF